MNFKQFRTEKGLTQAQAGALIGMSAAYWSQLETGQESPQKERAFARVLTYIDHNDIDLPLTAERMKSIKDFGLNFSQASEQIGASANVWSNLLNGHLPAKLRWIRSVNALLIELAEKQADLDLTPGGEIEVLMPQVLTPEPEAPVVEEEISDQPGLIPFAYNNNTVRCRQHNEEAWICVRDICAVIGHKNSRDAVSLIDSEEVAVFDTPTAGGVQKITFTTYTGMLQFLTRTRVEGAKPFQNWVYKEVLPTVMKTGQYQAQTAQVDPLDAIIMSLTELKAVKAQQVQMAAKIEELEARPAFDSSQSARATIHELQRIKERKRDLHRLKSAIVKQAEANTDSYSKEFRKHGRVWRYIHAEANPPVSCVNDYLTIAQINTAIEAAQILLTRLGGAMPLQLSININDGAA